MNELRQLLNGMGSFPEGGYPSNVDPRSTYAGMLDRGVIPGNTTVATVPVRSSGMSDKKKAMMVLSALAIPGIFALRGKLDKTIAKVPGLAGPEVDAGMAGRKRTSKKKK